MVKKTVLYCIIFLAVAILALGCASIPVQPYKYAPAENDGTLVIFRPWALYAGAHELGVRLDGQRILNLGTNEYATIRVSAGLHKVDVYEKETSVSIRENDKLYFKIEPNPKAAAWAVIPVAGAFIQEHFFIKETTEEGFKALGGKLKEKPVQYTQ